METESFPDPLTGTRAHSDESEIRDASCLPAAGTLYVVATPIGHRSDLSPRAAVLLSAVDVIAAEDTRMTQRLLDTARINGRMISLNEHNEAGRVDALVEALSKGQSVALVSDAGTPLISDPGYRLVSAVHAADLAVSIVPGPCAAIAALSASGLPTDRFWFEGFLPARAGARVKRLLELAELSATLVFYVPARDLPAVVTDLITALGAERIICLGRELTKRHETIHRANGPDLLRFVSDDQDQQRGEAVLVVEGNPSPDKPVTVDALAAELAKALPPSKAAAILARLSGMKRKAAWARIERARQVVNGSEANNPLSESGE